MEKFDDIFDKRKHKAKVKSDTDLSAEDLKAIIVDYKKLVEKETKKPFPQDAHEQLAMSRDAVFRSWWNPKASYYRRMEKIPDEIGTAANVQAMVYGNLGDTSATGVGFTRDPATGENTFYGEFLVNAQGEDVVAGIRTPEPITDLEKMMPEAYKQLREITSSLEKHYRDMQDFEFTIEDNKLYMLQTRNGKRTGPAAVRVAVEMVEEGLIDKKEAVLRVQPQQLDQLLHPVFDAASLKTLKLVANGIAASPGAAVGRAAFSADDAVELAKNGPVILVRKETTPDDIHGMDVAKGILTAVGGKSSHAAVVARGMGRPCVVGAGTLAISERNKQFTTTIGRQDGYGEGGRLDFARRHHRERLPGQSDDQRSRSEFVVLRQADALGRRIPRQVRRARQRGHSSRRESRAVVRRRRHRPVPHGAHVLRRGSDPARAGDDSGSR